MNSLTRVLSKITSSTPLFVRPCSTNSICSKKPPEEPPEGYCCGQGCSNCVWIEYGNSLVDFYGNMEKEQVLEELRDKVKDPNIRAFVVSELTMKWKNQ